MPNYRHNLNTYPACRQPQNMPSLPKRDSSEEMVLAMAYVPWQVWRDIYESEKGFHCGTIFQELYLPFLGKGGVKR